MGDEVNQVRDVARQSVDAFIDNRHPQLIDYLNGENDMQTLQNALNRLTIMNADVSNPALFAGGQVAQVELNEVRNIARDEVLNFGNDMIPLVLNSINALNNMHHLERAIDRLNVINADITNPALLA